MELYILRHGIAEAREDTNAKDDSQRRLTREGERKMERIAKSICALGLSFDVILTSPFPRSKETADIVARALRSTKRVQSLDALAAGESTKQLVKALRERSSGFESVLIVGHEPDLSSFVSLLVTGGSDMILTLKKGGLCKLTLSTLRPGRCAILEWLAPPSLMTRIR